MQVGLELPAAASASNIPVSNGTLVYPPSGHPMSIPANGTLYLNITSSSCRLLGNAANPLPEAVVLKKHYYFGFRPAMTGSYGEFDARDWAAHLGMGNETHGFAIAGGGSFTVLLCCRGVIGEGMARLSGC